MSVSLQYYLGKNPTLLKVNIIEMFRIPFSEEIEKKIQWKVVTIGWYYTYIPEPQILLFFLIRTSSVRVLLLISSRWQIKA